MANGDCLIVSCSSSCISHNMICLISYSANVIISVSEYLRYFQALLYQLSYVFLACETVASSLQPSTSRVLELIDGNPLATVQL